MPERPYLGLADALAIQERILSRAAGDGGRPIAVSVVDDRGDLVSFARQDGVSLRSVRLARDKAYTAALQESSTRDFVAALAKANRPVGAFADPRYVALAGGVPISSGSPAKVLGAVGVSGRSADEDHALAEAGIGAK
jgi:glc operon protein GlcG